MNQLSMILITILAVLIGAVGMSIIWFRAVTRAVKAGPTQAIQMVFGNIPSLRGTTFRIEQDGTVRRVPDRHRVVVPLIPLPSDTLPCPGPHSVPDPPAGSDAPPVPPAKP